MGNTATSPSSDGTYGAQSGAPSTQPSYPAPLPAPQPPPPVIMGSVNPTPGPPVAYDSQLAGAPITLPSYSAPLPPPPPPPQIPAPLVNTVRRGAGVRDARGIERGSCNNCPNCPGYLPPTQQEGKAASFRCYYCNCLPVAHEKLSDKPAPAWNNLDGVSPPPSICSFPGCNQMVEFDLNSGVEYAHCCDHMHTPVAYPSATTNQAPLQVQDVEYDPTQYQGPYGQPVQQAVKDSSLCILPGCQRPKFVEQNGTVHDYCGRTHAQQGKQLGIVPDEQPVAQQNGAAYYTQDPTMAVAPPGIPFQQQQQPPPPVALPPVLPSGAPKCAIPECPNPCHVDESGRVHDCCGFTHAMEHQRRLAIEQQQQVIKGVTHCLLPECNRNTWPFENYCGRTHANIGKQRGLIPPAPQTDTSGSQTKDSSLCILPGCNKPKHVESGITHDYCGRTHADQGKQMGIVPSAEREEDQCELPGCTRPKREEANRTHAYCCRDHADKDAPNRDARILTSYSEVQNYLDKFKNTLKVVSIYENPEAKPGGTLFERYKSKMLSLPKDQRKTCLAFHGTVEKNIANICKNGYNAGLRSGQAYGPGEYFATTPDIPINYCKGGKKVLLNELLLGQQGTHHTQFPHGTGAIVIMKDPAHDLPRYVVTFQ